MSLSKSIRGGTIMKFNHYQKIELSNMKNNLEWDYIKDINALIVGKRGSGKSFLGMYLAYQIAGTFPYGQLFVIDYKKSDFSLLKNIKDFPENRVASTKEEIFALLDYYVELLEKRRDYFNSLDNQFGKTARDLHMPPFYLVYDEFGVFTSTLDAKEKKRHDALIKKITLIGRAYNFGLIAIMQQASVGNSGLDSSVKEQFGLIAHMGNATPASLRQTFREDVEPQDLRFEVGQGQVWMDSFTNANKTYPFTAKFLDKNLLWKNFEINLYNQDVEATLFDHD